MRAGSIRLPVRPAWTTRWRCFWALPKSRRGRSPDLLLRRCSHRSLQRRVVPPACEPRHTRGAHNPDLLYNIDLVAAVGNGSGDAGSKPEKQVRQSVVEGKSVSVRVDLSWCRILKKKNITKTTHNTL